MDSTDVRNAMTGGQGMKVRKPYLAPGFKRLSLEAAKELLLRRADVRDPEVQHMLDRIEGFQGEKGS
jgi:hypothetical protein